MRFIFLLFAAVLLLNNGCNDAYQKDVRLGVLPEDETTDGGTDDGTDTGEAPTDQDDDGISDEAEQTFEMDPFASDSDHDGFGDGLEFVGTGGDPLNSSARPISGNRAIILSSSDARTSDPDDDRDGLGNEYENQEDLDKNNPDIDGDGYSDGLELIAGSDPFDSDSRPERNSPPTSNGTPNEAEPVDSDNDGLSDEIESLNGTKSGSRDTDSDGFSDGIEYIMGSDATNVLSVPEFEVPARPAE